MGGKGVMMVAILFLWALSATSEAVTETEPGLMMNFYKDTCPQAEDIIREQVKLLYKRHKNTAFSWLRNIFHDCAVESCDASLLLDSTRRELGEKEHDRSFGLRNFRYIEEIKEALERECPGVVSCSDILVLSAREGIEAVGGPYIPLKTGRRDGLKSRTDMLESYLPALEQQHVCEKRLQAKTFSTQEFQLTLNWDDLTCPICLDFPHNGVLLQCSSYGNGCRAFVCNTDHLHSNCLDRFISACGTESPPAPDEPRSKVLEESCKPVCPLCRGEVTGWLVVEEARLRLDEKKRCCEEERCRFMGTYLELRKHAQSEHPDSRPSEIDPASARRAFLNWCLRVLIHAHEDQPPQN